MNAGRSGLRTGAAALTILMTLTGVSLASCAGSATTATISEVGELGWDHPTRRVVVDPELKFELEPVLGAELTHAVGTPESSYLVWVGSEFGTDGFGSKVVALDETGSERWSHEFDSGVTAWPIDGDLMVFDSSEDLSDDPQPSSLLRFAGDTGAQRWQTELPANSYESSDFAGRAFASDGENLTVIDLDSGETITSVRFDWIGDVDDIRRGGGIAAGDGDDIVVLDQDLNEIARVNAPGSHRGSYADGKVLGVNSNGAELYSSDGDELGTLDVGVTIDHPVAIGDGAWAYQEIFGPVCGAVRATDDGLEPLWQADMCQADDVEVLDNGQPYVTGAWGVFNAMTGEPITAFDGQATIGNDGFLSVRLGSCTVITAEGKIVFHLNDVEAAELLDGGYVVVVDDPDTGVAVLRFFGETS